MKKNYDAPAIEIIPYQVHTHLLAVSPDVPDTPEEEAEEKDLIHNNYTETEEQTWTLDE